MDSSWRAHLSSDSRDRIVGRILENLRQRMPPGEDGGDELLRVAWRFERNVYQAATSQQDYLQKISMKLISMLTVRNARTPRVVDSMNLGEIDEEDVVLASVPVPVPVPPPLTTLPFVEVRGPDGMKKRFANGTRAGFVVDRFNKLHPSGVTTVACIQAYKEGEEPIEYGPNVELHTLHDKSWALQSVLEYEFAQILRRLLS